MSCNYTKPKQELARELREVARHAVALNKALTKGLNFELPNDFPKDQLIEITETLAGLPSGTAEGCGPPLQYARSRLPAIRRLHILSEELEERTGTSGEAPPPVLRGALIDQRLRDLLASVTTALDEYRLIRGYEPPDESEGRSATLKSADMASEAIDRSMRLEARLVDARNIVEETTEPGSQTADTLKRQISDARGLNKLARAELEMPKIMFGWYRRILDSLKQYPEMIKSTAATLKTGADILHIALKRWHEFEQHGTTFLVNEFKKSCDAFIAIADRLEVRQEPEQVRKGTRDRVRFPTKSSERYPEINEDVRALESYFMRLSGGEIWNLDNKRNVALRTDTLIALMSSIAKVQETGLRTAGLKSKHIERLINSSFFEAGLNIGQNFGQELMSAGRVWKTIPGDVQHRLNGWSQLEQESGTGIIETRYEEGVGEVTWKNNFLSKNGRFSPSIAKFICGYVRGVLEKLIETEIVVKMVSPTVFRFRQTL